MSNKLFLTAKTDRVFKAILGDEDNKELLKEFLKRIFDCDVEIIEFLQPEIRVETTKERVKTVDLLIKMNNKFVHIEMNSQYKTFLHNRNFIFFTSIFTKKTKRGELYDISTEYIHIDFTYGLSNIIDDYNVYYVMNEKNEKYIENFKIIEYNMSKITKYYESNDINKIKKYSHLIMLDLDKSNLRKLSKGDGFIMEFNKKLEELNEKETYEPALTYEEDLIYCMNTEKELARQEGRKIGLEEGKIEGLKEGKIEGIKEGKMEGLKEGKMEGLKEGKMKGIIIVAKNLLKMNMSVVDISKSTGLSKDIIEKLK